MRDYLLGKTSMNNLWFFVFLVIVISCFTFSKNAKASTEESVISEGHSQDEIKRGKRFFMGLLPFDRKHESCVSCHNITQIDTLNWNPSAMDIALKYAGKDFASFQQAVMQPTGIKMEASHQKFNIAEEDLKTVKIYLDDLAHTGTLPAKRSYNKLILFLFLGILITWALLDLIVFHKIKPKFIMVVIFIGALGYQLFMLYEETSDLGRSEGYQPDQPIKFSHQVHVTENQIDCMYCHHTAEESKTANIPSTNLCMNCHIVVREGSRSGKFEISKLLQAHEEERSIEWIRIHQLPDHVFFSHAQHVGAGNLDCVQCHGKVEEMHVVRQEKDLSMGFCLDCHRETKVDFKDNDYYSIYKSLHDDIKKGLRDSIMAADIGANDCAKCHY
ncbi:MAG TPA: cytochrome c3 family protein [Draconibacterium sp.]|nr:cytochrome c3 family protein [Draconibacterium sp.]